MKSQIKPLLIERPLPKALALLALSGLLGLVIGFLVTLDNSRAVRESERLWCTPVGQGWSYCADQGVGNCFYWHEDGLAVKAEQPCYLEVE